MSSKLFKTIKKKAGRLQDIVSVLQKLEEKKYVEKLSKLFEQIFFEEQKFTITELKRIMSAKPTNKYMDIDEQFRQNTQLFKANFEAINSIIINEVWEQVSNFFQYEEKAEQPVVERGRVYPQQTENQHQAQQVMSERAVLNHQENEHHQQRNAESDNHLELSPGISSPSQQNDSKILNKIGITRNQLVSNNSSSSINNSFAGQGQQENWVRTNMKQRNSSRSFENLNKGQNAVNDSQNSKRINSMENSTLQKGNQSILDIKKLNEKKLNNMNLSVSSVRSLSQSKLGITSPFSELHESKNPLQTSFSRAARRLMDKELSQSPGPTDYKIDSADKLVRKKSPKVSIGNTKRTSFIDEKQKMESCSSTPGPQYNVSHAAIYKPFKK